MEKMSKTSGKNMEKGLFDSPDTKVQLEKLSQSLKNGQKEMLEKAIKNKSEKEVTKILDQLNKGSMKNDESVKKLSERVYRNEAMNQKSLFGKTLDTVKGGASWVWRNVITNKWAWLGAGAAAVAAYFGAPYAFQAFGDIEAGMTNVGLDWFRRFMGSAAPLSPPGLGNSSSLGSALNLYNAPGM